MEILICSITTHQTTLPGRNGLDLNISRLYQSNQALWGDLRTSGDRGGYSDYATYYQNRYNLGLGWSFCFPSVQVEKIGYESNGRIYFKKELYYHTGDGRVYHVDSSSSSGGTYSTLEKYYDKDAKFNLGDTSFSNGQTTSRYSFITADQTKQYFAEDGRLLGIKDRFNNQITFKHTEKPVANYTPNNDFEYEETVGLWKTSGESRIKAPFSYDEEFGKDDTSSLKYSGTVKSKALSNFIPVLPNTEYYYSAYFKDQLNNGYTQLSCRVYDHNFDVIQMGFLAPRAKDEWCFAQSSMPTSEHLYHNV